MSRSPAVLLMIATAAAVLTACGSGTADYPVPSGPVEGVLKPPPGTILSANSTAQLGTVVIDGLGRTLYRFDEDSAKPPTATCVDGCAGTWPPVTTDPAAPLTLEGISDEKVGTVARPDGTQQVTIGGWPVYRHAADPAPGSTDGHGLDDSWFAVTPEGGRAEEQ